MAPCGHIASSTFCTTRTCDGIQARWRDMLRSRPSRCSSLIRARHRCCISHSCRVCHIVCPTCYNCVCPICRIMCPVCHIRVPCMSYHVPCMLQLRALYVIFVCPACHIRVPWMAHRTLCMSQLCMCPVCHIRVPCMSYSCTLRL